MCFKIYKNHPLPKYADKDIICYKVTDNNKIKENNFISIVKEFKYKYDTLYILDTPLEIELIKHSEKKTEYNIEKGFHSYSNYNNASGWIECSIIKCIIPKGSTYYFNPVRQEYVSDKIKIGKYNEINIKPINIFLDVFNYLLYKIKMIL